LMWLLPPLAFWLNYFGIGPRLRNAVLAIVFASVLVLVLRETDFSTLWQTVKSDWLITSVVLFLPVFFGLYGVWLWWDKRRHLRK